MKFLISLSLLPLLSFAAQTFNAQTLNCHSDAVKISDESLQSYDMSFELKNSGLVAPGGKLYINTFPPHPVEPNPFLKVKTEKIAVKDSLFGADGQIILYFSAGAKNYVLDVQKKRADMLTGFLRVHGEKVESIKARCYLFKSFP